MRTTRREVLLLCCISLTLLPAASLHGNDSRGEDEASPWLQGSETYTLWYSEVTPSEEVKRCRAFPLIIWGQPASNVKWVNAFHAQGIRSIAYVSFYKAPNLSQVEDRRRWQGGSPGINECRKNPFWRAVDLARHPAWALITEEGSIRRPFDKPTYPPGWNQVCTNVAGYQEAARDGAKALMEMGFDGLFIDNVHPSDCFGPEHGKHEHVDPEQGNTGAYKMLLTEIHRLVKSYGEDKVCVLNSGPLEEDYQPYGDALMWESYVFRGAERRQDWAAILQAADAWKPYLASGKAILALSYIGGRTERERKDHAYYAYACAKLSGFLWTDHPRRTFDEVRLGMPLGDMQVENGVYYRLYERGVVAVNPQHDGRTAEVSLGAAYLRVLDLYSDKIVHVRNGMLSIGLPGDSGRVYTSLS